eukprot:CAMPEP_0113951522 /NCGR_PEP_ID=MMETSP1339-20121228/86609_1 /TAXON_ID=94617 /ORGANISM="Fibrocapsa japonica" /LENGTH=64 /DNA_ID=CAMNT_0000959815 /DNA_START=34 /DNA_END=228 /DNA_ORIENTATION=+ /assembly_acc=CAM_ASM_000762
MIPRAQAIPNHLNVESTVLQVPHQGQAATQGKRRDVPEHLFGGFLDDLVALRVEAAGDAVLPLR